MLQTATALPPVQLQRGVEVDMERTSLTPYKHDISIYTVYIYITVQCPPVCVCVCVCVFVCEAC